MNEIHSCCDQNKKKFKYLWNEFNKDENKLLDKLPTKG